jgi:hypothetical protein
MEGLSGSQLLDVMQSFLSKGMAAGCKGYERLASEVLS